jgi:hypothetical protein
MKELEKAIFALLKICVVLGSAIMLIDYIKSDCINGYMAINTILGLIVLAWNNLSNKIDKSK